jgi:putative tricarboxylic transport membrane protein
MTPADFFAMMVLAFGTVGAVMGQSIVRGLLSLSVGLTIGLIGLDLQTGSSRLVFDVPRLTDGVETVVLIVSLFALGEVLYVSLFGQLGKVSRNSFTGLATMTREDWKRSWKPWLRGTAIGFPTGVLPAGGSELPTFLSYSLEKRLAKKKHDEFGKGAIEGVAGPEAANNANAAGAMVPLLALGLPTSATAAVMLAAFQQFDVQPGPLLFNDQPLLVWTLIASLFIGNLLLLVLNLPLAGVWAKLLMIPAPYLYGGIVLFAMVGAYVLNGETFDVWVAIVIGLLGLLFRRFGYPITPLILGVILGPIAEQEFRRALQGSVGDPSILIATPFSVVLYVLLILAIAAPKLYMLWKKKQNA